MGKACTKFIHKSVFYTTCLTRIHMKYYKTNDSYQVLQVTCASPECAMKLDKIVTLVLEKISPFLPLAKFLVLGTDNNTESNKLRYSIVILI